MEELYFIIFGVLLVLCFILVIYFIINHNNKQNDPPLKPESKDCPEREDCPECASCPERECASCSERECASCSERECASCSERECASCSERECASCSERECENFIAPYDTTDEGWCVINISADVNNLANCPEYIIPRNKWFLDSTLGGNIGTINTSACENRQTSWKDFCSASEVQHRLINETGKNILSNCYNYLRSTDRLIPRFYKLTFKIDYESAPQAATEVLQFGNVKVFIYANFADIAVQYTNNTNDSDKEPLWVIKKSQISGDFKNGVVTIIIKNNVSESEISFTKDNTTTQFSLENSSSVVWNNSHAGKEFSVAGNNDFISDVKITSLNDQIIFFPENENVCKYY